MLKKIDDVVLFTEYILTKYIFGIIKILRKINCLFLEDEEGERAPLGDHIFYYGMIFSIVASGMFFAYELGIL